MVQNERINIYYGSKEAYEFEKQNKRINENALYFIEGILYSGYELYSKDYKRVTELPDFGQNNIIYINTIDSSVVIWDDDKNEWIYLCMPASNEIINNSNSIATSSAVYKVLQNTKEYTDEKCNEMSESLTDTLNTAIENSIVDYNKNLFAESDKYNSISDIENAIDDITNRESVLQFSIEEEKNRAITAESEVKNTIETNKPIWDDKYTKVEIDNKFSAFETNIDWKEAVDTYSKIVTTYPNPKDGWTVNVKDTDYTYRYNGTEWVTISANAIPKATNDVDGLLSKEDHAKYEEAYSQKHSHNNKSILDTITSAIIETWNSAVTHISDTVKHITSTERTNWDDANVKKHTHSNKSILDSITASYTTEEKTKLNGIATGANKTTIAANLTTTVAGYALDATMGKTLNGYITTLQNAVKNLNYCIGKFKTAKYMSRTSSDLGEVKYAYIPYAEASKLTISNKIAIKFTDDSVGVFNVGNTDLLSTTVTWLTGTVPYVAKTTIQNGTNTLAINSSGGGYTTYDDELYQTTGTIKQTMILEISSASGALATEYRII